MLEFPPLRVSPPQQDPMPISTNTKMNGSPANAANSNTSSPTETAQAASPLPQALQNLQRLLQSQLANVNPLHLQQALQRQQQLQMADAGRKQLEQMHQQLQEQLQINLLQQTHMTSGPGKPNASAIQQLQQQQQQLVAQMQMTQQALILGQSLDTASKADARSGLDTNRQRHLSENFGSTGSSDGSLKENRPDNNNGVGQGIKVEQNGRGREAARSPTSPSLSQDALFSHGHCHWPGCDVSCSDFTAFRRHLTTHHSLDDKATAQTRVQMQIVSQLELQLNKEKSRLEAMMKHLRLENRNGELKEITNQRSRSPRSPSPKKFRSEARSPTSGFLGAAAGLQSPLSALTAAVRSPMLSAMASTVASTMASPSIRPKPVSSLVDKPSPMTSTGLTLPPGFDERRGRGDRGNPNLDPEMDIKLNREFYMNNDVRPPYTYAALIRYAILETPDQQLTLHEIYNWFTNTFMYFRRNAASWKNAVRHNLSLHKCFMRVENVKGAVWTVDDEEYHRRRPPRGLQSNSAAAAAATSASNSPTLTPQAPSLLDQSLSSMLGAAAAAAAAAAAGNGSNTGSSAGAAHLPFFNHAAIMEQMRRSSGSSAAFPDIKSIAAAAAAAQPTGLDSPPPSLDNRSTPGSLDLSRLKAEESPPTLLKSNKFFNEDSVDKDGQVSNDHDEETNDEAPEDKVESETDGDKDKGEDLSVKPQTPMDQDTSAEAKDDDDHDSSNEKTGDAN